MAATMATLNVAAVASPVTVVKSSFRGQRLAAGQQQQGVSVAARRSVFVVRAEDKGVGKNIQDAGEKFSAAVQRGAESVKDNLQGTQADVTSKAKKGANDADSIGSKISNQAEDLKDQLFGAGNNAQKDAEKNLNKAKSAAGSSGRDAQNKAGNVVDNVKQGLSDVAENVENKFKGKN